MDASKRKASQELVSNPFVKKRNLEWRVSPPPLRNPHHPQSRGGDPQSSVQDAAESKSPGDDAGNDPAKGEDGRKQKSRERNQRSTAAAIEAGEIQIRDHASHFSSLLSASTLSPYPPSQPRLTIPSYKTLYHDNFNSPHGAHFVIHQHDHPIAGTHYDLRLQINPTSSASWACMYGPPGDPNSIRLMRNATETRVHCLWNHLIETASAATGSLLIWDTGTYEVLERRSKYAPKIDPDSQSEGWSDSESGDPGDAVDGKSKGKSGQTEQEKLASAFAARKIRLRLNGTKLPRPYVLNLRLTKGEDAAGQTKALRSVGKKPQRRRRRGVPAATNTGPETSSSGSDDDNEGNQELDEQDYNDGSAAAGQTDETLSAMERELRELEDEEVRRTNAYTGATNTIGSVHQRKWYLSLDRETCGFVRRRHGDKTTWDPKDDDPEKNDDNEGRNLPRLEYPFYVKGPEFERSVVTGRLGADILEDEGVAGFVRRKGWRAVLK